MKKKPSEIDRRVLKRMAEKYPMATWHGIPVDKWDKEDLVLMVNWCANRLDKILDQGIMSGLSRF